MNKTFFFWIFLLLITSGCGEKSREIKEQEPETVIHSDNSELEEAKAIARKIYKGIDKVEKREVSREEFEAYAASLQEKLNSLIVIMEEQEVQELERYKNQLMEEISITESETTLH